MCALGWQTPFWGMHLGGLTTLLLVAVVIVIASKWYSAHQQGKSLHSVVADKHSSLQILENRLARGEISIEEFEKLKQVLHG